MSSNSNSDLMLSHEIEGDRLADTALRPTSLAEFVGQQRVKDQLSLMLDASKARGVAAEHILLAGPPGLGKTTLAMIVATHMNAPIRLSSGPTIQHAGDLASMLSSLLPGEVLFIDEIHRISRAAEEMLYLAMEDFRVDIMVGKGAGASSIPLEIAPFTLVGATTRAGMLPAPLRDRFGFTAQLDFYEVSELDAIVQHSAVKLDLQIDQTTAVEIASRSRGTPRIANRLLRRTRDYAQVHAAGAIDVVTARSALELYEVDELGLDRLDRAVLLALTSRFSGGPVGLSTLALAVGEEAETVDSVCEPYLVRSGLLVRTSRGRVATPAGWKAVGLEPPNQLPL